MKPISVTAHYERKLNTGDYSSVTLSTWTTIELEPGDTAADALAHGLDICRAAVKDAAAPFVKAGVPVTVGETFQGKPVSRAANGAAEEIIAAGSGTVDYWKE